MFANTSSDRLYADGLLSRAEVDLAQAAELRGNDAWTLGYEAEIFESVRQDIRNIRPDHTRDNIKSSLEVLKRYGYHLGNDGIYEPTSPVARHPQTLAIVTRGIVRLEWLPEETSGEIPVHISLGSRLSELELDRREKRLIRALRIIDLIGGTSPERLMEPVTQAASTSPHHSVQGSWNKSGVCGVSIGKKQSTRWEGSNERVEFRTPNYRNGTQFSETLWATYFLGRGALSDPGSEGARIYEELETWFQDYCKASKLPEPSMLVLNFTDQYWPLKQYLTPYAKHLDEADLTPLRQKAATTIAALCDAFDMTLL